MKKFILFFFIIHLFSSIIHAQGSITFTDPIDVHVYTEKENNSQDRPSIHDRTFGPREHSNSNKSSSRKRSSSLSFRPAPKFHNSHFAKTGQGVVLIHGDGSVSIIYNDGNGFTHFHSISGDMYTDGNIDGIADYVENYMSDGYARIANQKEHLHYTTKYQNEIIVVD